jgi:hypothetical protein
MAIYPNTFYVRYRFLGLSKWWDYVEESEILLAGHLAWESEGIGPYFVVFLLESCTKIDNKIKIVFLIRLVFF